VTYGKEFWKISTIYFIHKNDVFYTFKRLILVFQTIYFTHTQKLGKYLSSVNLRKKLFLAILEGHLEEKLWDDLTLSLIGVRW
jgi:hypothetical protein